MERNVWKMERVGDGTECVRNGTEHIENDTKRMKNEMECLGNGKSHDWIFDFATPPSGD